MSEQNGPYSIKESGDRSGGFMGYIVVGPGIVNTGDDAERGVARQMCDRLNAAYAAGRASRPPAEAADAQA